MFKNSVECDIEAVQLPGKARAGIPDRQHKRETDTSSHIPLRDTYIKSWAKHVATPKHISAVSVSEHNEITE
jgi:hypothetical protein